MGRSRGPVGAAMALAALSLAACSSPTVNPPPTPPTTSTPPITSTPPTTSTPAATSSTSAPSTTPASPIPPTIPSTGAYLGAWLHPVDGAGGSFSVEQRSIPAVEQATGRPLGILHIYAAWRHPAPVSDLAAVTAAGSIPLLDWGCGATTEDIASGADDDVITAYAQALKTFGHPVFLRWCWEMNLVDAHPRVGGPSGFAAAWVHIWTIFHDVGATNVAFVWCPALSGADPAPYYPGSRYVDWIGIDGYDRSGSETFAQVFSRFYQQWLPQGKPMMVAETGAAGTGQSAYIHSIDTGMPQLPAFKAVVYFDAPGPAADWQLGGDGLAAFAALSRDSYFSPT